MATENLGRVDYLSDRHLNTQFFVAPLLNSDGSAIISGKFIIILLESLTDEDGKA